MSADPYARLDEAGDAAFARAIPRTDNPHPQGSSTWERWFATWDAAALEAARLMKAEGCAALYREALEVATLLRDLREHPKTLTPRAPRYRDTEARLLAALARVQSAAQPSTSTGEPACRAS